MNQVPTNAYQIAYRIHALYFTEERDSDGRALATEAACLFPQGDEGEIFAWMSEMQKRHLNG